jgi:hypothetical protein
MPKKTVTLSQRVESLERQLEELQSALAKLQAAEPAKAAAAAAAGSAGAVVSVFKPIPAPPAAKASKKEAAEEGVSSEVVAVITAAVTQFLGLHVRIRGVRPVQAAGGNPWAQQGRVFIQASHNLIVR